MDQTGGLVFCIVALSCVEPVSTSEESALKHIDAPSGAAAVSIGCVETAVESFPIKRLLPAACASYTSSAITLLALLRSPACHRGQNRLRYILSTKTAVP